MSTPLFDLGQTVATPGALEALRDSGQHPAEFLRRHLLLEQGELDAGDHRLNRSALADGARIFSAFLTAKGERLWVITEASDDEGHRDSTCILTPEEY